MEAVVERGSKGCEIGGGGGVVKKKSIYFFWVAFYPAHFVAFCSVGGNSFFLLGDSLPLLVRVLYVSYFHF